MFDWIFKKKPPTDDVITTVSIIRNIEGRRMRIDEHQIKSSKRRDDAIETLALFPLNYPVDKMEIALSCKIDWALFLTIINRLIEEGTWEFIDEPNRRDKGRRIQHLAFDSQMFGVPYGTYLWVHRMLDSGFAKIFGKDHRKILHDPESVEVIRKAFGDEVALVAAWHIHLDSPTIYKVVNGRLVLKKRK